MVQRDRHMEKDMENKIMAWRERHIDKSRRNGWGERLGVFHYALMDKCHHQKNRLPLNWLDLKVWGETGRDKRVGVQVVSWGVNDAQCRPESERQIDIFLTLTINSTQSNSLLGEKQRLLQPQMTRYAKLIWAHCLFSTHRDSWFFFWTSTFWVDPVCYINVIKMLM